MLQKSLNSFFKPKNIAIIGVSKNPQKLGTQILQNILNAKFQGDIIAINPKHAGEKLLNQPCLAQVSDHHESFDLVVMVIPAKFSENIINDCIKNKTKNIIIISAGFGEVGNHELENKITQKCANHNINILGPNCLGVIFPYANLNASFADGYPQKGNICFVSQSGAFCTAILDWAHEKKLGFSHFISLGNKSDISEDQILATLQDDDNVEIFAFYLESIKNGSKFIELIQKISSKKPIIILEPGSSAKAAEASASHTGSLAPNHKVLQAAYKAAGAIQVRSMRDMFSVIKLLSYYKQENFGKNCAVLTNAGGVGVLTSDLIEDANLILPELSQSTQQALKQVLPAEANTKNPIDIIGDAKADRYENSLKILTTAPEIDEILVLLTPQAVTEVEKTAKLISTYKLKTNKPIIACFVGGTKIRPALKIFNENQIPSFRFPEEGLDAITKIVHRNQNKICQTFPHNNRNTEKLTKILIRNKNKTALCAADVQHFLDTYDIDSPQTLNFNPNNWQDALEFSQDFFPKKLVGKLISQELLHKTDQKGVILSIQSTEKLEMMWKHFQDIITKNNLTDAKIQLQEQIDSGLEIITGISSDKNFGKILLFGTGGIYTEIWQDTSLRVLPVCNQQCFKNMISETKIGQILAGTRGQIFPLEKVYQTLEKIQQLILDFPQIASIDCNPILITEKRVICVDMKIILKN
jgi:acetyltransferase